MDAQGKTSEEGHMTLPFLGPHHPGTSVTQKLSLIFWVYETVL